MRVKDWVYPEATEVDTVRDFEIVKSCLPKKRCRVLDAGGGTGRISIPLAKEGYEVTLLDISKTVLRFARRIAKREGVLDSLNFVQGDVCDLSFQDNSFDLVLALRDVVNYAADQLRAARELVRVLRPGHHLIASVSNKVFWLTKAERFNYELEKIKDLLVTKSMLTEIELRNLFKGLRVKRVVGSGYCSGNLPKEVLDKRWMEVEREVGDRDELKFSCEYLVLIGVKHG